MTDTTGELESIRAELQALRTEVERLRGDHRTGGDGPLDGPAEEPASNRRGFLRLAGAAAAGATVAAVAGGAHDAAALTGDAVRAGQDVSPTSATLADRTSVFNPDGAILMPLTFIGANYTSDLFPTFPDSNKIGVAGVSQGVHPDTTSLRTGVYGRATRQAGGTGPAGGQGVFGSSNGVNNPFGGSYDFGVFGTAPDAGWAVYGYAVGSAAFGVKGRADAGTAVAGESFSGISMYAMGGGRILQELRVAGAPASGSFKKGEMIRDAAGDMYLCVASGSPGTWRKVTAQHPDYPNAGGSVNMLATPIRLVDTRHDPNVPFDNGGVPLTPFVPFNVQVTGTIAQGLSVPAGATGVIGNFTVTQAFGPGYCLVWPSGAVPATSNINYTGVTVGPGALANSFVCGLDAAGKLNMMCAVTPTHAILDIAGFTY